MTFIDLKFGYLIYSLVKTVLDIIRVCSIYNSTCIAPILIVFSVNIYVKTYIKCSDKILLAKIEYNLCMFRISYMWYGYLPPSG